MNATVIIGLALLCVLAAIIAFLRTPPEFRYRQPEPEDDGAEYAEQYTPRERMKFVAFALGVVLPFVVAADLWVFPALEEFAGTSYCYEWFGVSGTALLIYGLFVGLPLGSAVIAGLPAAYYGVRMIRAEQNPPPGTKVMKRTKIRCGRRAVAAGYAHQLPLVFLLGLAAWGEAQAEELLAGFEPTEADFRECAPNLALEPTEKKRCRAFPGGSALALCIKGGF